MTSPQRSAWLVLVLVVLAACVPETGPGTEVCRAAAVEIELTLTENGLEPESPSVCAAQEVTLVVESSRDGVLHLHGYDAEVPAFQVSAGETHEVTFTADRSGQFPIEFHPEENPEGVGVGVFTVHEQ